MAADCCLRHEAPPAEHHAQMQHAEHADHHHHAQPDQAADADKSAKADTSGCDMNCVNCHAHHCTCVMVDAHTGMSEAPAAKDDTPYLSSITSPLPDNLYRPPLAQRA